MEAERLDGEAVEVVFDQQRLAGPQVIEQHLRGQINNKIRVLKRVHVTKWPGNTSPNSAFTCPVLVPTAMVSEPLNFRALTEGKPWTLAAHRDAEN